MSRRFNYCSALLLVILMGLLVRSQLLPLSPFVKKYGGSALWALLVYLLIRVIAPRATLWKSALMAFAVAVAVELSQLYHASWIDTIRETRLGALILGSVFNWPDIPAYAVGILIGALLDHRARLQNKSAHSCHTS